MQSWGVRLRSYDKTSLRPASVLILQLWSWSYTFGLASNSVMLVPDKTLCDMKMLKCYKHVIFRAISVKIVPKVTADHNHFMTFLRKGIF